MSNSKGLRKHQLDFEIIETNNPKVLVFLDSSNYFTPPTTPILQLLPPGNNDLVSLNVESGKITTFNSHSLGFTNYLNGDDTVELPDGVWQATYRICPYNELYIVKSFVRADQLNKCLFKIYKDFDTECCGEGVERIKKQLMDIYLLLESAKVNAMLNFKDKADKDFSLASKKVTKLINAK